MSPNVDVNRSVKPVQDGLLAKFVEAQQTFQEVKALYNEQALPDEQLETYNGCFSSLSVEGFLPEEEYDEAEHIPMGEHQPLPHEQVDVKLITRLASLPHCPLVSEELVELWFESAERHRQMWATWFYEVWFNEPME